MRRLASLLLIAVALVAVGPAARADESDIDVLVVSGSLDGRLMDFIVEGIEGSSAHLVVIQLDSPATLDGDLEGLLALVADPPVPVAVYAGPQPARVSGGALRLLAAAPIRGAAPGVILGPAAPTRAGGVDDSGAIGEAHPDLPDGALSGAATVEDDLGGFLDLVEPSIGQFVVGLQGRTVRVDGADVVLSTAVEGTVDGVPGIRPAGAVRFVEPGVLTTTLHLTASPDVAFFFLVMGLGFAVLEFYAAGPGLAAAVAMVCLLLAGLGIAVLPVAWWAVALVPLGVVLYTIDFQRNDLGWKSLLGTIGLLIGGLGFTDAAPQMVQTWWIVLLVVIVAALWFGFALTTLVRARFSTQTIGREHLIGRTGIAEGAIAPEGTVLVDGARWKARSTRGSGIGPGDSVTVKAVSGIVLEVDLS